MSYFDYEYKIVSFSVSETKTKKLMGNLILENTETKETVSAKIWEEDLNNYDRKIFKTGNVVKLQDGNYNDQYKTLNIKRIKVISEAKSGLDEEQREECFNKILTVINDFKDEKLKTAILKIIFENEDLFKITPAAKSNHHNYVGGLMQHILECISVAKANFPVFKQEIDEELILAACVMHDIGKMFEYVINEETGIVEISEEFQNRWVTHTQFGFSWANQNEFYQLARIIAAHHGRKDWGAIIDLDEKNVEPMLYLMHHIDDISAKFGAIHVEHLN